MKKTGKPFIVKLAILTVITSFVWTGFDVYRRLTTKPEPNVPAEILSPIIPELNQETLARLEKTIYLEGDELGDTLILSSQGELISPDITPKVTEEIPTETPLEESTGEPTITENE